MKRNNAFRSLCGAEGINFEHDSLADLLPGKSGENYFSGKQLFQATECDPRGRQKMKEHLVNEIHRNAVREARNC